MIEAKGTPGRWASAPCVPGPKPLTVAAGTPGSGGTGGADVVDKGPITRLVERLETGLGQGAPLLCAACGNGITTPAARTTLFGQYVHHKTNPYGFHFVIGCFSEAPGCAIQGEPVPQDTWFPGYTWRFALCDHCATHLGWYYESPSQTYFYGLVLERLVEEDTGSGGSP